MTLDYEKRSYENLIWHYRDELRRILRGDMTRDVLSVSEKILLRREKIICYDKTRHGKDFYFVTLKARALLEASPLGTRAT